MAIPPLVTEETRAYWEAAKSGRLLVQRCDACGAESFPPRPMCRVCRSRQVSAVEVEAAGHVYSYTINHQRWLPNMEVPFVIVLVEFTAHPGVRVPGLLRGSNNVFVGMRVRIGFEPGPEGFAVPSFSALSEEPV
jgi:uncharacterized protein